MSAKDLFFPRAPPLHISSFLSYGEIIWITVGTVAAFVIFGVIIWFLYRRWRQEQPGGAGGANGGDGGGDGGGGGLDGLSAEEIAALPRVVYPPPWMAHEETERTRCQYCLADYDDGEEVLALPPCHHLLHLPSVADCGAERWLETHRICLTCQGVIVPPQPPAVAVEVELGVVAPAHAPVAAEAEVAVELV